MLNVGVIGYGDRIKLIVDLILKSGKAQLSAIADPRCDEIRKELEKKQINGIRYYKDAEEMLNAEKLDGVCIGTRCSLHTKLALLVAKYGIPMFLEKPVCTNFDDLEKLKQIPHMNYKTVVSFPLRLTKMMDCVKEIVDSGKLGEIAHIQAYNNVHYGRVYYHAWYRDESETGGLFLQKATHDLDYINHLLGGLKPIRLCAMKSKLVFKGDMPAGQLCRECEKYETCTESPLYVTKNGDAEYGPYCCFATDTGNEDSGSVIVEYENGMHVVYSQNFISRNGAGKRGARLIGYKGTLEFDWNSGKISVFRHLERVNEEYKILQEGSHSGGDEVLVKNFIDVMMGKDTSLSPLSDGMLSATMCLAAKKSAEQHVFCDIDI